MNPRLPHSPRSLPAALTPLALAAAVALAGAPARADFPGDSPAAEALGRAEASAALIVAIPDRERTFDNTVGAIDDLIAQLELDTNMKMFLAYVSTDEAERAAGLRTEEDVTNWRIDFAKRKDLYRAVKTYAETRPSLEGEQKRLLEHSLRDYRRAGMELSQEKRDELAAIQKEITRLSIDFEKNIREDETRVPLTWEELVGMPDDYLDGLTRTAGVYLVGMSYPEFIPLLDNALLETTRKKAWIAYKRRGGMRNVGLLEQILQKRAEAAHILGYADAADFEIEIQMAKNADTVMRFYERLQPLVREKAKLDWAEFLAAKRAYVGDPTATLYPWDFSFYQNKLKKDKYAVDMEVVREYFPLQAVIDGLFGITQSLYGIEYVDITDRAAAEGFALWHPDVKLYEVRDKASRELLGHFYIDLHPRDNKYSHAAQWGLAQHKVWSDGRVTRPVAALVCNFTKPTRDRPSLLTHEEVETFFHEFGHCLHTILSDAHYWEFSGTNVERDFVEAPSQMFENWVWDADVLRTFARHYETGEPIPSELVEGMLAARNLGSGLLAEHQFFYGLFDMECHLDPAGKVDTTKLAEKLWDGEGKGVELYAAVPDTYFQASFGHLMGYQAGYYGYQWSLVYACDMFQRFKELGMLDPDAGMYYRRRILSQGGTKDGLDLVRGYLGREPDMTAYLKHLGLEVEEGRD